MSPEEFERLKNEEKAHLRQLRELKALQRDAQRKVQIANAVTGMRNPELEASTDALTERLMRDAAHHEARLDLAVESAQASAAASAQTEADREALRQAEAAALVAQLKARMGGGASPAGDAAPSDVAGASAAALPPKTIGRPPPPDPEAPPAPSDAKTIGRPRSS